MRSPIYGLRQRKVDLTKSAKAILAAAEKENRDLNDGEAANHYKILKSLESLERDIIAEEARLTGEKLEAAFPDENALFAAAARGEVLPDGQRHHAAPAKLNGRVGVRNWADIFGGQPRGNSGFRSFTEYLHAVRVSAEGIFDPRLQASMTEGNFTQAGALVPEQYAAFIIDKAIEDSICLKRCQVWPMTSDVLKVPGIKDPDHSSGVLFGGIQEFWYDELAPLDDQNIETYLIQLTAHKLGLLANAASELVEDAGLFEGILTAKLQAAAQWYLDKNFLFGGSKSAGRPLGMLTAGNPALVVVSKDTHTANGTIGFPDVCNMFTAMAPACRTRAEWLFTDELIPSLTQMQLVVRNDSGVPVGGSATPLFAMTGDNTGILLGRPVTFSEKLKSAGSQGDAAFLCFDQYAIGMRREMQLRRSIEAGFKNDSIYWRLTTRVDGMPTWDTTCKLENGNITSPFVTLQARA